MSVVAVGVNIAGSTRDTASFASGMMPSTMTSTMLVTTPRVRVSASVIREEWRCFPLPTDVGTGMILWPARDPNKEPR